VHGFGCSSLEFSQILPGMSSVVVYYFLYLTIHRNCKNNCYCNSRQSNIQFIFIEYFYHFDSLQLFCNIDRVNTTRDPETLSREMRTALLQLNVKPPYVLVGHSYGGAICLIYATLYPADVKGLGTYLFYNVLHNLSLFYYSTCRPCTSRPIQKAS
jgi:pimeloyl-ACP methyl ester carboxylesterase